VGLTGWKNFEKAEIMRESEGLRLIECLLEFEVCVGFIDALSW
jgi:hypothetical protein